MPFDKVPLRITPEEFMTEIMVRYLVRQYKAREYFLRNMSYEILRKIYDAFCRRELRKNYAAFR